VVEVGKAGNNLLSSIDKTVRSLKSNSNTSGSGKPGQPMPPPTPGQPMPPPEPVEPRSMAAETVRDKWRREMANWKPTETWSSVSAINEAAMQLRQSMQTGEPLPDMVMQTGFNGIGDRLPGGNIGLEGGKSNGLPSAPLGEAGSNLAGKLDNVVNAINKQTDVFKKGNSQPMSITVNASDAGGGVQTALMVMDATSKAKTTTAKV